MNHARLRRSFAYLADMALQNVAAIPREGGGLAIDDIARAGPEDDVLIAMTFKPYRTDVLEAVALARATGGDYHRHFRQPGVAAGSGASITDSSMQTESPQFFTSTVAVGALLESLMAFVVADADPWCDREYRPVPRPSRRVGHLPGRRAWQSERPVDGTRSGAGIRAITRVRTSTNAEQQRRSLRRTWQYAGHVSALRRRG